MATTKKTTKTAPKTTKTTKTTKVKEFTRNAATEVKADAMAALEKVAKNLGLTVQYSGGKFSAQEFTLKITFAAPTPTGAPAKPLGFDARAAQLGLSPKLWGKEITWGGFVFTVHDLNLRASRYPVTAIRKDDGKRYRLSLLSIVGIAPTASR